MVLRNNIYKISGLGKPVKWWVGLLCGAAFSFVPTGCKPGTDEVAQAKEHQVITAAETVPAKKMVTLGGTVTEIVCALGDCNAIVATDLTSTYPKHMQQLPSMGYRNNIKAEGIISTGADFVLAEADYLDESVVDQLSSTGVAMHVVENNLSKESTIKMVQQLGKLLGKEAKAKELQERIEADFAQVNKHLAEASSRPKVLFVYARGQGTLNIGGKNTFAEKMINLAGGQLAVNQLEEFKPLTAEAVIAANPDYLLFFDSGQQSLGGVEGIMSIPGIKETTAGKKKNIIAMDGLYLSGFGPRVGKAVDELVLKIHPELQATASVQ
ncbi:hemin ABC transporter substrate-binding protein [Pontibacter silvestris]|uniref:Hemin ABC transporter substrate-binding protein n=1 Tax=Pontibacter silvestris TaxID=2305183 RepID=A0ABW4X2E4_9BACT|nr:ABC transporter substrate-binding protein [Pontibacter silvestris]MCC9134867.1 ABC transporter substrate-binding protein [Pontibacter silvestris]